MSSRQIADLKYCEYEWYPNFLSLRITGLYDFRFLLFQFPNFGFAREIAKIPHVSAFLCDH
jgi:hypothetical protein